jgi:hypothetical protein
MSGCLFLVQGEQSITRIEENNELVMVMERRKLDDGREGQFVLRVGNIDSLFDVYQNCYAIFYSILTIILINLFVFLKATADKLVQHLISHSPAADPTYIDDFLLTYMTFLRSPADIASNISSWFEDPIMREKVINLSSGMQ